MSEGTASLSSTTPSTGGLAWTRALPTTLPPTVRALSDQQRLLLAQGAYYGLTGIWPLVSLRTFEMITGPKADGWLVKTVGVLVGVIGGVLGLAGRQRQPPPEVALLAVGSALGLAAIDITYVARRRISPIYLADAVAELGLVALWLLPAPRATLGQLPMLSRLEQHY